MTRYTLKKHAAADTIKWVIIFLLMIGVIGAIVTLFVMLDRQTTVTEIGAEQEANFYGYFRARQIELFAARGNEVALFVEVRTGVELGNVAFKFAVAEFHGVLFGDYAVVLVFGVNFFHYVDAVGLNLHSDY